jgi:hypothetical protein
MCSVWRGQIPAPLGLHRVHLHYTISLLHNTLSPTVHSNGTAFTRPSMVQNKNILEQCTVALLEGLIFKALNSIAKVIFLV